MEVLGMLWTAPSLTFSAWPATWFGCISGDFSELGQREKGLPLEQHSLVVTSQYGFGERGQGLQSSLWVGTSEPARAFSMFGGTVTFIP